MKLIWFLYCECTLPFHFIIKKKPVIENLCTNELMTEICFFAELSLQLLKFCVLVLPVQPGQFIMSIQFSFWLVARLCFQTFWFGVAVWLALAYMKHVTSRKCFKIKRMFQYLLSLCLAFWPETFDVCYICSGN